MAGGDIVQVGYRSGNPADPWGRFELTVRADGGARLEHRDPAGVRAWSGRVEPVVWRRLADALDRSAFADVERRPIPPDSALRELTVEPGGTLTVGWHATVPPPLGTVFRILDALVRQVSGGVLRSTADELPPVVHRRVAELRRRATSAGAAAFGSVGGRPAYAVIDGDGAVFSAHGRTPLPAGDQAPPRAAALSSDADLLATAGDDGVITVYDARTGRPLHARAGHRGPVTAVAAAAFADRRVVLSAGDDGDVRMWDAETFDELGSVSVGEAGLTSLCPARVAGHALVCAGADDGVVRVWNAKDVIGTLRGHRGRVGALAADEDLLASGGADGVVRLWDLPGERELHALEGHADSVTGVALTRAGDRTLVGSCSLDGTVRTWDARTGEPLAAWPARSDWLTGIAFIETDDGPAVVTAATDGGVRLWAALTGEPIAVLADGPAPSAVAGGRRLVVSGHKDGSLRLWSERTLVRTVPGSGGAVTAIAFGPGGLICGTEDGTVRVHDLDGEEVRVPTPHNAPVFALAFAGDLLVSGGADATVRTWDARSGAPRNRLLGHTAPIAAVATGDVEGRTVIASGGYDRVVRTWDAVSGRPLLAVHGHMSPVYALAFGDGLLASAGYDGVVRVWDAATGAEVTTLPGDHWPVRALCFSGDVLAVAAGDGAVRLWHLPTGDPAGAAEVTDTPLAAAFIDGRLQIATTRGLTTPDV